MSLPPGISPGIMPLWFMDASEQKRFCFRRTLARAALRSRVKHDPGEFRPKFHAQIRLSFSSVAAAGKLNSIAESLTGFLGAVSRPSHPYLYARETSGNISLDASPALRVLPNCTAIPCSRCVHLTEWRT